MNNFDITHGVRVRNGILEIIDPRNNTNWHPVINAGNRTIQGDNRNGVHGLRAVGTGVNLSLQFLNASNQWVEVAVTSQHSEMFTGVPSDGVHGLRVQIGSRGVPELQIWNGSQWVQTLSMFTVTWNLNDGQWSNAPVLGNRTTDVIAGNLPVPPANVTREFHNFDRWDNLTAITSPRTINAIWIRRNHTITWNPNQGNWTTGAATGNRTTTVGEGLIPEAPATVARNLYDFSNWGSNPIVTGPRTQTAQWARQRTTITWILNGGHWGTNTSDTANRTTTVDRHTELGNQPAVPNRTGNWVFAGWLNNTIPTAATQTRTAQWVERIYVNVTFNPNGGSWADGTGTGNRTFSMVVGTPRVPPVGVVRGGHWRFEGWSPAGNVGNTNPTIVAQWWHPPQCSTGETCHNYECCTTGMETCQTCTRQNCWDACQGCGVAMGGWDSCCSTTQICQDVSYSCNCSTPITCSTCTSCSSYCRHNQPEGCVC